MERKKLKYVLKLENAKDCLIFNFRKVLLEISWEKNSCLFIHRMNLKKKKQKHYHLQWAQFCNDTQKSGNNIHGHGRVLLQEANGFQGIFSLSPIHRWVSKCISLAKRRNRLRKSTLLPPVTLKSPRILSNHAWCNGTLFDQMHSYSLIPQTAKVELFYFQFKTLL